MYANTSVNCEDLLKEEKKHKLDIYRFVGYNFLIINLKYSPMKDYRAILQEIQSQTILKVYGKILLNPKSLKNLKNSLVSLNNYSDFLICVQSTDKDILTFSINDSRVDSVLFPNISELNHITAGIVSLLKTNNKILEISLKDVLSSKINDRSRLFHEMSKFLSIIKNKTHLLVYGGSEESIYEIRGPHEIATIFTAIFNLPIQRSKSLVQSNPERIQVTLNQRAKNIHYTKDVNIIAEINKEEK